MRVEHGESDWAVEEMSVTESGAGGRRGRLNSRPRPGDRYAEETRASIGATLGCLSGSAIRRTDSRSRTGIGMR